MRVIVQSSKEFIRHAMHKMGGKLIISAYKKIRGVPHAHLAGKTNAERFSAIYNDKVWTFGGHEGSLSGPGSHRSATKELVESLESILRELEVKRLIDIGCGDFGWMQLVKESFEYVGVDVVESVISELNKSYGSEFRSFIQADATVDDLPAGDAVVCREVLFHLSFDDIWGIIDNLKRRDYTYLIATSDRNTWFNSDITSGDHRPLNLERSPFRFSEPIHVIKDDKVRKDRIIGVWRLADISRPARMKGA